MPTRSIIYFHVRSGQEAEFIRRFKQSGILELAQTAPGWLGGELCRANDGASTFTVTALWAEPAHYDAWRARPRPTAGPGGVAEVCDEITEGRGFSVVHAVGR